LAFDDPATAKAVREYRSRARIFTLVGLATLIVGLAAWGLPDSTVRLQGAIGLCGVGFGPVLLWVGVVALVRAARMARLLRAQPWEGRVVRSTANFFGNFLLVGGIDKNEGVYVLSGTKMRVERFTWGRHANVLFAGLPDRWVVAAPPDRSLVVIARRPLRSLVRRRARTTVTRPPLTPAAQARFNRELRICIVVVAVAVPAIMLVAAVVNMWLAIGLMFGALVAMRIIARRWASFPRQELGQ
jgi:hypothetical protein